jgi:hypothetical protein
MARAGAAVVLAFTLCCLLVTAAPEEEGTAIAVHEEEGHVREETPKQRSSLLCLVFRCGGGAEPAGAGGVAAVRGSSTQERQALDGWSWTPSAVAGTVEDQEVHGKEQGAYDSDSDWDSDCDSDDEGGIVGWLWRLADGF